jgi:hypothetical protein
MFSPVWYLDIFLYETLSRESEGTKKIWLISSVSITKEAQGLAGS